MARTLRDKRHNRLRSERLRRGWTLPHLASLTGIRPPHLSYYESGRIFPHQPTISRLARAFEIPEDRMYRWLLLPARSSRKSAA